MTEHTFDLATALVDKAVEQLADRTYGITRVLFHEFGSFPLCYNHTRHDTGHGGDVGLRRHRPAGSRRSQRPTCRRNTRGPHRQLPRRTPHLRRPGRGSPRPDRLLRPRRPPLLHADRAARQHVMGRRQSSAATTPPAHLPVWPRPSTTSSTSSRPPPPNHTPALQPPAVLSHAGRLALQRSLFESPTTRRSLAPMATRPTTPATTSAASCTATAFYRSPPATSAPSPEAASATTSNPMSWRSCRWPTAPCTPASAPTKSPRCANAAPFSHRCQTGRLPAAVRAGRVVVSSGDAAAMARGTAALRSAKTVAPHHL